MNIYDLWFGSEESLLTYFTAMRRLEALEALGPTAIQAKIAEMWAGKGGAKTEDPFAMPPLWQAQDGVAVVDVSGSLISGHAGFFRLFGVLGYDDISEALIEAASAKEVNAILLAVDSGGGAVNGLENAGNMIRQVASVKPVWSQSEGGMLSAAYWLGASADSVYASKTAQVGSVGTLMIHTEYSKQLEQEGVKKTVITHGQFKGVGNPYEPLSEKGREQIQGMVDEAGEIFVEYVSERRGTTPAKFQKTMGEGRVFMGRPALQVGLIDGVMSFADAMNAMKKLDKVKPSQQNSRNQGKPTMKVTLASALVLSLIGGAAVESLDLKVATATAEGTEPDADAQAALMVQAQEIKAALDKTAVEVTEMPEVKALVETHTAALETAKAEVTAAKEESGMAKAAAQTLTAERDVARELSDSMALILRDSISVMSVSLQGAKDAGKDLTGQALLDEHARLAAQFKSKYPAGGVAAVGIADVTAPTKKVAVDPLFLHAVRSLQPQGSRK